MKGPGDNHEIVIASSFERQIAQRGEYWRIEDDRLADQVRDFISQLQSKCEGKTQTWTADQLRRFWSGGKPSGRRHYVPKEDAIDDRGEIGDSLDLIELPKQERAFLAICQILYRDKKADGDRCPDTELLVKLVLEWSGRALAPATVDEIIATFKERHAWRLNAAKQIISNYPEELELDVVAQADLFSAREFQTLARAHAEAEPSARRLLEEIAKRIGDGAIVEPGPLAFDSHSNIVIERPIAVEHSRSEAAHA